MTRRIIRKTVSFLVVVAILTTMCLPAFGAESRERFTPVDSLYGYTFTENYLSNGKLELFSYYNGELQKKYTIEAGNPLIHVDVLANPSTRTRGSTSSYTIPSATADEIISIVPYAERWAFLGYINYDENPGLGFVRAHTSTKGNMEQKTVTLSANKGTPLDDVVAFLGSFLLTEGIGQILISAGVALSAWQVSLVASLVGALGVAIYNGIVQEPFSEKVKASVTSWDFMVTSFADKDSADGITRYLYDQGQTVTANIGASSDAWDTTTNGITMSNWKSNSLALLAWENMFPIYQYPGVLNFSTH